MISPPSAELLWALSGILLILAIGSCVRLVALGRSSSELRTKRLQSLRTWWILATCVCIALVAGRPGMCLLMASASVLALREFVPLVASRTCDRLAARSLYATLLVSCILLLLGEVRMWSVGMPFLIILLPCLSGLVQGEPRGYVSSTSSLIYGGLLLVYALSHTVVLFAVPQTQSGPIGPAGWFLYLLLLTEINDIAQALIGRRFGAHKRHCITPVISPNKTWEGFLGGLGATMLLSVLLASELTTLTAFQIPLTNDLSLPGAATPLVSGAGIALLGFLGDINMSAIKRDAGVKDGSQLLPGMGGMIDRIDSLTFTAPAFTWFVLWLA